MKIKPCYRNYKPEIGVLYIGFRREDETLKEMEIWLKYFPDIKIGESVGMVVTDVELQAVKQEFPGFDFDTEDVI